MLDAEVFYRLNTWGAARDSELVDLRSSLTSTQAIVDATFVDARGMLLSIIAEFRLEAEALRQHSLYEAQQGLARLNQVVAEARGRFDAQDARVTQDLGDLARHMATQLQQAQHQPQQQQAQQQQQQPMQPRFVAAPTPAVVT